MECKFVVGQRVVCVETDLVYMTKYCVTGNPGFVTGGIYTIADMKCEPDWPSPALTFKEIHDPLLHIDNGRIMWASEHFRPVKTMEFWVGEKQEPDAPVPTKKERV